MKEVEAETDCRLSAVLKVLGIARSTWYYRAKQSHDPRKRGPIPLPVLPEKRDLIISKANHFPILGYQKIAMICRQDMPVTDRETYRVMAEEKLLHLRKPTPSELHQSQQLYKLLPEAPNQLWQMDVTYVHIPTHGWRYLITVIDYYSRYLLQGHFTDSYSAREAIKALTKAKANAEAIRGPLTQPVFLVTDNGSTFIAKEFKDHLGHNYSQVRIQYRTPTQLGLLERFHKTLKQEEIYQHIYDSPAQAKERIEKYLHVYNNQRPHWALKPVQGGDCYTPTQVYKQSHTIQVPRWQKWAKAAKKKVEQLSEELCA